MRIHITSKMINSVEDSDEDSVEPLTSSVPSLIGLPLKKYFNDSPYGPAGWYKGKVVYYHKPYFRVVYEDGDQEDMTIDEVLDYTHWIFE